MRARSDLEVELNVDLSYESGRETTRHVPTLEAGIYRITQEAITNTIKHAGATRAVITLVERSDVLSLCVEDDGCGFDLEGASSGGFGLIGIRERVELLGGTITVTSSPGAGTRIETVVPVTRRPSEDAAVTTADAERHAG